SPASIQLEAWLNGSRLDALSVVADASSQESAASIVRVPLEPKNEQVLELRYQLAAGSNSRWSTTLEPPRLRGSVFVSQVRWHVVFPDDSVVVLDDPSARTESIWTLNRGLAERRPAYTSAQLDNWFRTGEELEPNGDSGETNQGTMVENRAASLTNLRFC